MSLYCNNVELEMECDSHNGPVFKMTAEFVSRDREEIQREFDRLSRTRRFETVTSHEAETKMSESVKRLQQAFTGAANAFKPLVIHSQSKIEQMKKYTYTLVFENCEQERKTVQVSLVAPTMIRANRMFDNLYAREQGHCSVNDIAKLDGVEFQVVSVVEEAIPVDAVAAKKTTK